MASAPPVPPSPAPVPLDLVARGLELMPIPAAHLDAGDGAPVLRAVNAAFRQAGLGGPGTASPLLAALGAEVAAFLASDRVRAEFNWCHGGALAGRHYRVTLARPSAAPGGACQAFLIDHTGQQRTEASLRREMCTDSLTGLPNRTGFGDLVEAALAGDAPAGLPAVLPAVLVVDLDRFGRLNASLGGLAGDELLITVARRIQGTLRAGDALARIGGDVFGILLRIAAREEAHAAAARVAAALAGPVRLTGFEIGVAASIGIAFAEQAGAGDEEDRVAALIRHAQFAVKQARESGRPAVHRRHAFAAERERFGIETRLRRAVVEGRLRLTFQPIRELATGRLVAMEALTRWPGGAGAGGDGGEETPPDRFIPVAEESGLIVPLGRWALGEALATLAEWDRRAGRPCGVQMAVNVSPLQLQRDRLPDAVAAALRAAGLPGHRLKLELTESALAADPARAGATMRSLKALGVGLAMDDFGTGYSSLALLRRLPIDTLKIDRGFVAAMAADPDDTAIVRAILALADALGMQAVAEGVETAALARRLAAMGCALGQGFLYARPLAPDAAWALVAASLASA